MTPVRILSILATIAIGAELDCNAQEPSSRSAVRSLLESREISFSKARKLGPEATEELRQVLTQETSRRLWASAIIALGHAGNAEDAELVLRFVDRAKTRSGKPAADAVLASIESLGHFARAGSRLAMDTLIRLSGDALADFPAQYRQDIGFRAFHGLALSGRPEARQHLRKLLEQVSMTRQFERYRRIKLALSLLGRIRAMGAVPALEQRERILAFVRKQYIHGVPYRAARSMGPEAVPTLGELLHERADEKNWSNVVVTLGFIAHESSTEPLLRFLRAPRGEVTLPAFRAYLMTMQALGHIARAGDETALTTLQRFARLKAPAPGLSFGRYKGRTLLLALQKMAIQGLGISATQAGRSTLVSLEAAPGFPDDLRDDVAEALSLIDRINAEGEETVFGGEKR